MIQFQLSMQQQKTNIKEACSQAASLHCLIKMEF